MVRQLAAWQFMRPGVSFQRDLMPLDPTVTFSQVYTSALLCLHLVKFVNLKRREWKMGRPMLIQRKLTF